MRGTAIAFLLCLLGNKKGQEVSLQPSFQSIVILNLFQDNELQSLVILKLVQDDEDGRSLRAGDVCQIDLQARAHR